MFLFSLLPYKFGWADVELFFKMFGEYLGGVIPQGICNFRNLRQFGIRICLEKFQLPSLFNAHGQCLGLILEETVCSQCRTEIHEEVMYGAMA